MGLRDWIRDAGAPSEKDSDRGGFLSYSSEAHAAGHGLYNGLTSASPTTGELPDNPDIRAEPHYFKGAYVLGTLLQLLVLALTGALATGTLPL